MMLSPFVAEIAGGGGGGGGERRSTRLFYFPWVVTPEAEVGMGTEGTRRSRCEECWGDVEAVGSLGGGLDGGEIGSGGGEQRVLAVVRASRGL